MPLWQLHLRSNCLSDALGPMLTVEDSDTYMEVTVRLDHSAELQVSAPQPARGYELDECNGKRVHSKIGDVTRGQEQHGIS